MHARLCLPLPKTRQESNSGPRSTAEICSYPSWPFSCWAPESSFKSLGSIQLYLLSTTCKSLLTTCVLFTRCMANNWGRNSCSSRILRHFNEIQIHISTGPEIRRAYWRVCWIGVLAMFALLVGALVHTRSLGYSMKQILHKPVPIWWFVSCEAIHFFQLVSCSHADPVGMSGYYDSSSHIDLGLPG